MKFVRSHPTFVLFALILVGVFGLSIFFYINEQSAGPQRVVYPETGQQNGNSAQPSANFLYQLPGEQIYTNDGDEYLVELIDGSDFYGNTDLNFEVVLTIRKNDNSDINQLDGISFVNGAESGTPEYREIFLHYYGQNNNWGIQFVYGTEQEFFWLDDASGGAGVPGEFLINISSDGKAMVVLVPSGEVKEVELPSSFYETSNQGFVVIKASPGTDVVLSKLSLSAAN